MFSQHRVVSNFYFKCRWKVLLHKEGKEWSSICYTTEIVCLFGLQFSVSYLLLDFLNCTCSVLAVHILTTRAIQEEKKRGLNKTHSGFRVGAHELGEAEDVVVW